MVLHWCYIYSVGGIYFGCFWVVVVVSGVLVDLVINIIFCINDNSIVLWQRVICDTVTTLSLQFLSPQSVSHICHLVLQYLTLHITHAKLHLVLLLLFVKRALVGGLELFDIPLLILSQRWETFCCCNSCVYLSWGCVCMCFYLFSSLLLESRSWTYR